MAAQTHWVALQLMRESKWAKLCVLLHRLKRNSYSDWHMTKEILFRHASSNRQFSTLATIVECSIKCELSSCYALVPGLRDSDAG